MTNEEREAIRQKWRDELIERWTGNGQRYYPGREDDAETLAGMYFDQREEIARLNARVADLERDTMSASTVRQAALSEPDELAEAREIIAE